MGLSKHQCLVITLRSLHARLHSSYVIAFFVCSRVCWANYCHTCSDLSFSCSNLVCVFLTYCVCKGKWFVFKWPTEGPKCFLSHVFSHVCRILRLSHLQLLSVTEFASTFLSFSLLQWQLFSTCPDSHLYLNDFEALIVSSLIWHLFFFLLFLSNIFDFSQVLLFWSWD